MSLCALIHNIYNNILVKDITFENGEIFLVLFSYLIVVYLLMTNQITYGKSNELVIITEILYVINLVVYLFLLDLGLGIKSYDTYKNIMLILLFLFTVLSIGVICGSLCYRMRTSYLRLLVDKHIVRPWALYVIIIFSYISLMVVAYKLIPLYRPISKDSLGINTLNILPLLLVQSSFIISLFRVNNIVNSKIKQCRANYYVIRDHFENLFKIQIQDNLLKQRNNTIKKLLYFIIHHIQL